MFSQSALSSLLERVLKTPLLMASEKSEKEVSALSRNLAFNLTGVNDIIQFLMHKPSGSRHCEMPVTYSGPCQKSMIKLLHTVKSFIIDI